MIPFNNLTPLFDSQRKELMTAVHRVMQSGIYLMGPELAQFEKEFAQYAGVHYAVGVGSGTDALTLALKALNLHGEEVLMPANAYPSAFGVAMAGVKIKLCDVDSDTLNVSSETIRQALTKKTRAIVIVHLYGLPAPMIEIMELAKEHNLLLIEDCAQAIGAKIGDFYVGTFGHAACFSFYPTKNLAAMGDGGAVVTNNQRVANKIRQLRVYGEDVRYHSLEVSSNSRLDEMQASILRIRLKYLKRELKQRALLAHKYRHSLSEETLLPREIPTDVCHAFHLFVMRLTKRDTLKKFLDKKDIGSMVHYPSPIHLQQAFSYLGYQKGDFPVSEKACEQVLSLPLFVGLQNHQQGEVIAAVNMFTKQYASS